HGERRAVEIAVTWIPRLVRKEVIALGDQIAVKEVPFERHRKCQLLTGLERRRKIYREAALPVLLDRRYRLPANACALEAELSVQPGILVRSKRLANLERDHTQVRDVGGHVDPRGHAHLRTRRVQVDIKIVVR